MECKQRRVYQILNIIPFFTDTIQTPEKKIDIFFVKCLQKIPILLK